MTHISLCKVSSCNVILLLERPILSLCPGFQGTSFSVKGGSKVLELLQPDEIFLEELLLVLLRCFKLLPSFSNILTNTQATHTDSMQQSQTASGSVKQLTVTSFPSDGT